MSCRNRVVSGALLLAIAVPASAHFGVFKNKEKFPVHHPPEVKLPANVSLRVEPERDTALVRNKLATALTPIGVNIGAGDTEIILVVSSFHAEIKDVPITRSTSVHTGDTTEYDKKGNAKTKPVCRQMDAQMTQRQWKGDVSLVLQVRDLKTGVNLLNRPIGYTYTKDALINGPDIKGCEYWSYGVPQGAPDNRETLSRMLFDDAMQNASNHLTGWTETRDALLAVCDELKPGNAKARAGDLKGAIGSWTAATPRENKPDKIKHLASYKEYNIAVATMLLAAGESEPAQAQTMLNEAWTHFENAKAGQPGEKYFNDPKEFPSDYAAVKQVVDRAVSEAEEQNRRNQELLRTAEMSKKWLSQPLDPNLYPDESADISKFRHIVRERLSMLTDPEQLRDSSLAEEVTRYGVRLGLSPGEQSKVTHDEGARWRAVTAALKDYDQALDRILQGRTKVRLTADDIKRLDMEIDTLRLTLAMVQPLEAKRGISRSAPPAAKAPAPKNLAPKTPVRKQP